MNKIIFQLGLLAFFVCIIFFASQNHTILDTIARSFIVFVGVVFLATLVLAASMLFTNKTKGNPADVAPRAIKSQRKFDTTGKTIEPVAKSVA
ncbi:MAG: hypothetical protein HY089_07315 [Ignavibacteriales bacterium]|nr:hypothetical protein [Ignavibacteriales bacterium]